MVLKKLALINFRNHADAVFRFDSLINCFTGPNGAGKTNLLDAIHYLSFTKGFINSIDSQNILQEQDFFVLRGDYEIDDKEVQLFCGQKRNQKKQFKFNKKDYEKLSEHIGKIPLVLIVPSDILLISEGSEERRKFLDSVISQYDRLYLDALMAYNRMLNQRNAWLKQAAKRDQNDWSLVHIMDEQMNEFALQIHEKRKTFMDKFLPLFKEYYAFISMESEAAHISYQSQLFEADFTKLCEDRRRKDLALEYTSAGIHKDDLLFTIQGQTLKKFASQGQQKSFIIALKLAQFDFMAQQSKAKPILLLDDIFEKLDQERITQLIRLVSEEHFGQIFITDTHKDRIAAILDGIGANYSIFELSKSTPSAAAHDQI
jgi:DNA replication and repair protein RecF